MECHEYEKLFEKYFDREITILEYKAVRSHLGRCQHCREIFFDHLFAVDLLDNMPMQEPTNLLTERVMQRLPAKATERTNWRRLTIGVAACIFLALTLSVVEQNLDQQSDGIRASVVVSDIKSQMRSGKRSVILPNNATIKGDLNVDGDVVVLGKVYGKINAKRVIVVHRKKNDLFRIINHQIRKLTTDKSKNDPVK